MLGKLKPTRQWNWAAYGKHPAVKDYFWIGHESPLVKSFSDWVERGYRERALKNRDEPGPVAWRFWARGSGKNDLLCGVVKDSSDSLGRNYPLLIAGTGYLEDWEDQWDLLPFACEKTWSQIEYLSAQTFNDFTEMENDFKNIRSPQPAWSEFREKSETLNGAKEIAENHNLTQDNKKMDHEVSRLSGKSEGFIFLDQKSFDDPCILNSTWHKKLRALDRTMPNALFTGGTVDASYLAFFKRPLSAADFVRLWSTFADGVRENGSTVIG